MRVALCIAHRRPLTIQWVVTDMGCKHCKEYGRLLDQAKQMRLDDAKGYRLDIKELEQLLKELDEKYQQANKEACELAAFLCKSYYPNEFKSFEFCDSVAGVISQIDNICAGMSEKIEQLTAENERLKREVLYLRFY